MPLYLTRQFQRRFEALPGAAQNQVRKALENLRESPHQGKKLSGDLEGHYSWRIGRYRILYTLRGQDIFAETVRHRKEVYRR